KKFVQGYLARVLPELLEPVARAHLRGEDVDHDVKGVDDGPATLPGGLDADNVRLRCVQHLLELNAERADVGLRGRGRDDEIVRDGRDLPDVEHAHVAGLLVVERAAAQPDEFPGLSFVNLHSRSRYKPL